MKLRKTAIALASLLMCSAFAFSSCQIIPDQYVWQLTEIEDGVDFHTELQSSYLSDTNYENVNTYATGQAELSLPEAIRFEWSAKGTSDLAPAITGYELQISTDRNFSDYISYTTTETHYDVYNLQIATDYYWRVSADLDGTFAKTSVSKVSTFTTTDVGPRNLKVDGVTNVRDLGGWLREDGTRVKQGMIYRCGRLNTSISDGIVVDKVEIEITEAGIATMHDLLGVRGEIDLRRTDNNEIGFLDYSPLGEDVTYYARPMNWNVNNILTGNVEMVKSVFEILADEDNYPIIYHCNIGTDRTGLFAYLINGLMGVSEDDLFRDYLFSNFGKINSARSLSGIKNSYIATIKKYPGDSLSEKIYNCLVDLGVPSEHLDSVIEILTEY